MHQTWFGHVSETMMHGYYDTGEILCLRHQYKYDWQSAGNAAILQTIILYNAHAMLQHRRQYLYVLFFKENENNSDGSSNSTWGYNFETCLQTWLNKG